MKNKRFEKLEKRICNGSRTYYNKHVDIKCGYDLQFKKVDCKYLTSGCCLNLEMLEIPIKLTFKSEFKRYI